MSSRSSRVKFVFRDILGRQFFETNYCEFNKGVNAVTIERYDLFEYTTNVQEGVILYTIVTDHFVDTKRMFPLKR